MSRTTMFSVALAVALFGLAGFAHVAESGSNPYFDWAAGSSGGWCCAKPRRACVPSQLCVRESVNQGGPCMETVASQFCKDLCDEWRKQPGGRGKACGGAP